MAIIYCPSGTYYSSSQGGCVSYSAWYWWGRWVLTGVIILVIIAVLLLLGCISARRRRRAGTTPMYGTGWMGGPPKYTANPSGAYYQAPPPQYPGAGPAYPMENQNTGTPFNQRDGYYATGQDQGVSPPPNAHVSNSGGEPVYAPPAGPPPGKA